MNVLIDPAELEHLCERLESSAKLPFQLEGRLTRSVGLTLEVQGIWAPVGTVCYIKHQQAQVRAVVTGFTENKLFLMPIEGVDGLPPGASVVATQQPFLIPVGAGLLGRVIDGAGNPLDDKGPLTNVEYRSMLGVPLNPLKRRPVSEPMDVGVRAINSLLSIGRGQRLGLMAGSGVGKSVLLGMLARMTVADVVVVGLIGERGREVKEFIEHNLGAFGLGRAVVVASPADYSPLLRLYGTYSAMAIAEHFRDEGREVLLLLDSLTRCSQAQREIALSMGEPPATKGYPPSAFAILPQIIERAGNGGVGQGSITAIFTVLAEGDDQQDPIVDAARAVLDGHFVLSRKYAEMGHYPALDIEASVSRVMTSVVSADHSSDARTFKKYFSVFMDNQDLINMGAYVQGANKDLDGAILRIDEMKSFLQQGVNEVSTFDESLTQLSAIVRGQATTAIQES